MGESVAGQICAVACAVLSWYAASLSLTFLMKYILDTLGFQYPILVTFIHFGFMSLLLRSSFAFLSWFPDFPAISGTMYLRFIVPIALCTAADISLSNESYSMVSVSVMTVIKSSIVVVTYLLGLAFGLEVFRCLTLLLVGLIMGAISLTVRDMEVHNSLGVVFLLGAVVASAIRWVIIHHMLQTRHLQPLQLLILTQPAATFCLAPAAVAIDVQRLVEADLALPDVPKLMSALFLVALSVLVAFAVHLSEFRLVGLTSSLSMTVAGVGKEMATILISVVFLGERITVRAFAGIGLSIVLLLTYSVVRFHDYKHTRRKTEPGPAVRLSVMPPPSVYGKKGGGVVMMNGLPGDVGGRMDDGL
ncbi:unnamed protein product [Vitrella brassicaformis CCMP3155]|uniref:Sugar phosphate transporter domain-containing protein n=2 Tax=Vitrella brassicaformis TaxID=1169539 RepID=A0A0G4ETI6_VITBC|nr:unnamed protein product [Vitrella brassicaformis CCMP3155]|mmetsp:Transcript_9984/g.28817  ORF Transcript_9984/g.28817 Transcript_9984/m.28817 type:complete len:361 (+) Transcript_9984:144-1226(+)|eukprot:CEM00969.1 unnamed protein product [Vitrella brassicaformis CCMP3155]